MDLEALLGEIDSESPCGDDLSYDPDFYKLRDAASGGSGGSMVGEDDPSAGPDWRDVQRQATALLGRTKDLRVVTHLTKAELQLRGLSGLAEGLALLRGLLERFWDHVHPQLDPDDGDPTRRVNCLRELCDHAGIITPLRATPLVEARGIGRYSYRDLALATGEIQPASEDETPPDMSSIAGAFADCPLEELQATADAAHQSVEHLKAVEELLTEKVGAAELPDLSALSTLLRRIDHAVGERMAQRAPGEEAAEVAAEAGEGDAEAPSDGSPRPAAAALTGEIRSREDVIRALDKICAYYERHEPSSPVPLLMRRSKKLVAMDFMDIVRNMAPSGVTEVEAIRGPEEEESYE